MSSSAAADTTTEGSDVDPSSFQAGGLHDFMQDLDLEAYEMVGTTASGMAGTVPADGGKEWEDVRKRMSSFGDTLAPRTSQDSFPQQQTLRKSLRFAPADISFQLDGSVIARSPRTEGPSSSPRQVTVSTSGFGRQSTQNLEDRPGAMVTKAIYKFKGLLARRRNRSVAETARDQVLAEDAAADEDMTMLEDVQDFAKRSVVQRRATWVRRRSMMSSGSAQLKRTATFGADFIGAESAHAASEGYGEEDADPLEDVDQESDVPEPESLEEALVVIAELREEIELLDSSLTSTEKRLIEVAERGVQAIKNYEKRGQTIRDQTEKIQRLENATQEAQMYKWQLMQAQTTLREHKSALLLMHESQDQFLKLEEELRQTKEELKKQGIEKADVVNAKWMASVAHKRMETAKQLEEKVQQEAEDKAQELLLKKQQAAHKWQRLARQCRKAAQEKQQKAREEHERSQNARIRELETELELEQSKVVKSLAENDRLQQRNHDLTQDMLKREREKNELLSAQRAELSATFQRGLAELRSDLEAKCKDLEDKEDSLRLSEEREGEILAENEALVAEVAAGEAEQEGLARRCREQEEQYDVLVRKMREGEARSMEEHSDIVKQLRVAERNEERAARKHQDQEAEYRRAEDQLKKERDHLRSELDVLQARLQDGDDALARAKENARQLERDADAARTEADRDRRAAEARAKTREARLSEAVEEARAECAEVTRKLFHCEAQLRFATEELGGKERAVAALEEERVRLQENGHEEMAHAAGMLSAAQLELQEERARLREIEARAEHRLTMYRQEAAAELETAHQLLKDAQYEASAREDELATKLAHKERRLEEELAKVLTLQDTADALANDLRSMSESHAEETKLVEQRIEMKCEAEKALALQKVETDAKRRISAAERELRETAATAVASQDTLTAEGARKWRDIVTTTREEALQEVEDKRREMQRRIDEQVEAARVAQADALREQDLRDSVECKLKKTLAQLSSREAELLERERAATQEREATLRRHRETLDEMRDLLRQRGDEVSEVRMELASVKAEGSEKAAKLEQEVRLLRSADTQLQVDLAAAQSDARAHMGTAEMRAGQLREAQLQSLSDAAEAERRVLALQADRAAQAEKTLAADAARDHLRRKVEALEAELQLVRDESRTEAAELDGVRQEARTANRWARSLADTASVSEQEAAAALEAAARTEEAARAAQRGLVEENRRLQRAQQRGEQETSALQSERSRLRAELQDARRELREERARAAASAAAAVQSAEHRGEAARAAADASAEHAADAQSRLSEAESAKRAAECRLRDASYVISSAEAEAAAARARTRGLEEELSAAQERQLRLSEELHAAREGLAEANAERDEAMRASSALVEQLTADSKQAFATQAADADALRLQLRSQERECDTLRAALHDTEERLRHESALRCAAEEELVPEPSAPPLPPAEEGGGEADRVRSELDEERARTERLAEELQAERGAADQLRREYAEAAAAQRRDIAAAEAARVELEVATREAAEESKVLRSRLADAVRDRSGSQERAAAAEATAATARRLLRRGETALAGEAEELRREAHAAAEHLADLAAETGRARTAEQLQRRLRAHAEAEQAAAERGAAAAWRVGDEADAALRRAGASAAAERHIAADALRRCAALERSAAEAEAREQLSADRLQEAENRLLQSSLRARELEHAAARSGRDATDAARCFATAVTVQDRHRAEAALHQNVAKVAVGEAERVREEMHELRTSARQARADLASAERRLGDAEAELRIMACKEGERDREYRDCQKELASLRRRLVIAEEMQTQEAARARRNAASPHSSQPGEGNTTAELRRRACAAEDDAAAAEARLASERLSWDRERERMLRQLSDVVRDRDAAAAERLTVLVRSAALDIESNNRGSPPRQSTSFSDVYNMPTPGASPDVLSQRLSP